MQTTPASPTRRTRLQNEDLNNLKPWLESNNLSLNVSKAQSTLIGSRNRLKENPESMSENPEPALKIEEPISMVKHIKYLGVQIEQHLLWD